MYNQESFMMMKQSLLYTVLAFFLLSSCNTQKNNTKLKFNLPTAGALVRSGSELTVKLDIPTKHSPVDSIAYFVNGAHIDTQLHADSVVLQTNQFGLGTKSLQAKVYKDGVEQVVQSNIVIVPVAPKFYSYKVVNEFAHDPEAFTQGLELHNGYLYESTGQYDGKSSLRRTKLETGEVLKKINLENKFFGEGLTIVDNKIIQLTWREKVGFIYDLNSFAKIGEFNYDKFTEGWGICYDGERLIVSDGTNKLYFLDKDTYKVVDSKEVFDHKGPKSNLNELEYIDGKIFANVYQEDIIVIINPSTGAVEGEINLLGIYPEKDKMMYDNELNGIAYDRQADRLFVTGKNWAKLFEIELISR